MARDWEKETHQVRGEILDLMGTYGDNVATVPFCEYLELREGEPIWCVDLHVKVRRKTEFEVSGEGPTLGRALKGAYIRLCNESQILRQAERSNATFGVVP